MKKLLNSKLYSFLLFAMFFSVALLFSSESTFAATKTWDGEGADNNFSTGANWSGDSAPSAGDDLVFSTWTGSGSDPEELTNDLASTEFASLTGSGGSDSRFYDIDTLKIAGGGTVTGSSTINFRISSLNSDGALTLNKVVVYGGTVSSFTTAGTGATVQNLTANSATVASGTSLSGTASGSSYSLKNIGTVTIQRNATYRLCGTSGKPDVTTNFVFGGGSGGTDPKIVMEACLGGEGVDYNSAGAVFKGNMTLNDDATITADSKEFFVVGKTTTNGNQLLISATNGTRIIGTGSTGYVVLGDGSLIAPGSSPGCLTTTGVEFNEGASYQFEVGGTTVCTEYDQIIANGTVNLGNGTLDVSLYNSYKPSTGETYTIISNDGTDAITGTFLNLAEGSTFTSDDYVYSISYVGGDGNDVTLTVESVPGAPDTGFEMLTNNPLTTLLATSTTFLAMLLIVFKLRRANIYLK